MNNDVINLMSEAASEYKNFKSIRGVAKSMGISEQKAKKLLISANVEIESEQFREIRTMRGMSCKEIAGNLGVTERYINSFMPYTKGVYVHGEELDLSADDNRARIAMSRLKKDNYIKYLRIKAGLTQFDLAKKLNVPEATIAELEDKVTFPNEELLTKISQCFGCSVSDFTKTR